MGGEGLEVSNFLSLEQTTDRSSDVSCHVAKSRTTIFHFAERILFLCGMFCDTVDASLDTDDSISAIWRRAHEALIVTNCQPTLILQSPMAKTSFLRNFLCRVVIIQGFSKPSDMGARINFPQSELDKLRALPVWKTLSGKRVAVQRNRHFSLADGADVGDLPLPTGAAERYGYICFRWIYDGLPILPETTFHMLD